MSTAKRVRRRSFSRRHHRHPAAAGEALHVAGSETTWAVRQGNDQGRSRLGLRIARNPAGRQVWFTLGTTSEMKIDEAREAARTAMEPHQGGKAARIKPPKLPPDSVATVCQNYLQRVVIKGKHPTANEKVRIVNNCIHPLLRQGTCVRSISGAWASPPCWTTSRTGAARPSGCRAFQ